MSAAWNSSLENRKHRQAGGIYAPWVDIAHYYVVSVVGDRVVMRED